MIVYPARDIRPFVMYCVSGKPRSSLLIESTDSDIFVSMGSPFGPAWTAAVNAQTQGRLSKGQRSHDVGQIGKKVSDFFNASVRGLLTLKRQKYGLYIDGESYLRTVA